MKPKKFTFKQQIRRDVFYIVETATEEEARQVLNNTADLADYISYEDDGWPETQSDPMNPDSFELVEEK